MRRLADSGRSIIFITHKLREVLAVSDRISVMRHGRIISTEPNEGVTAQQLASLMVGRSVLLRVDKSKAHPSADRLLEVDRLTAIGDRGETAVSVRLVLRPGGRDRRTCRRAGQRSRRAHRMHRRLAPSGCRVRVDLRNDGWDIWSPGKAATPGSPIFRRTASASASPSRAKSGRTFRSAI